jgi:hypothetical protein
MATDLLKTGGQNHRNGREDGSEFRCPITKQYLCTPAQTPCGHIFEIRALRSWLRADVTRTAACPVCHARLANDSYRAPSPDYLTRLIAFRRRNNLPDAF